MKSQARIKHQKYHWAERLHGVLRMLVVGGMVAAIIWGWFILRDPARFPINQVSVVATFQHIQPQQVRQIISPYLTKGFFGLDVSALQRDIQQLPWVASVAVERVWPSKVMVKINEQVPVALWGDSALLNEQGQVFTPSADTLPTNLPKLIGSEQQAQALWAVYKQIQSLLAPIKLYPTQLVEEERGAYKIELTDGTWIFLGRNNGVNRLARFVQIYPKIFTTPEQTASRIDLRYDNGLAIGWQKKKAV